MASFCSVGILWLLDLKWLINSETETHTGALQQQTEWESLHPAGIFITESISENSQLKIHSNKVWDCKLGTISPGLKFKSYRLTFRNRRWPHIFNSVIVWHLLLWILQNLCPLHASGDFESYADIGETFLYLGAFPVKYSPSAKRHNLIDAFWISFQTTSQPHCAGCRNVTFCHLPQHNCWHVFGTGKVDSTDRFWAPGWIFKM